MPDCKTSKMSPLQHMRLVCIKNGPSLPVGWQLRRCQKSQALLAVPFLLFCGPVVDLLEYIICKYFRHRHKQLGFDIDCDWMPECICWAACCILRILDLEALDDN